jgi:CTP synthase (UTP-ammonia lyase)
MTTGHELFAAIFAGAHEEARLECAAGNLQCVLHSLIIAVQRGSDAIKRGIAGILARMKDVVLLGDRNLRFVTHRELEATLGLLPSDIHAHWVGTDTPGAAALAANADALWVVPGSPFRNDAVVYSAIQNARLGGQPFLGTCAGFQYAAVEFARNAAGIRDAAHAETAPASADPVIDRLACSLVGEQRQVTAVPGTRVYELLGAQPFSGFHWCNYGLAEAHLNRLTQHGFVIAARANDAGVEAFETRNHPFFLATLFQPQIGSLSGYLNPIIKAFIDAA